MYLEKYCNRCGERITISAQQASTFAKEVAEDFNPIHDADNRRFCVPGDLLFSLLLWQHGLSERMAFRFNNMVGSQTPLLFKESSQGVITVTDEAGKSCIEATHEGETTRDPKLIEAFTRRYVAFSGLNFPHFLGPLMEQHGVLFNPHRPLVIYDSMAFELQDLHAVTADLSYAGGDMQVDGKRAIAHLRFKLERDGTPVGTGSKKLIISGLRPYDPQSMQEIINIFNRLKDTYQHRNDADHT